MIPRLILCLLFIGCLLSFGQKDHQEFSYSGVNGPSHWGDLNPSYATCKLGREQSPIDIRGARKTALPALQFSYRDTPLNIINNGHTIQVNYQGGSWLIVGEEKYELRQFHFHYPSEEHVNGKPYPMVVHLVHAGTDGKLAVIAVLIRQGLPNPALQKIWDNLPKTKDRDVQVPGATINASAFLPKSAGYYTFQGSLTTPPCTEGVTWFVMKNSLAASSEEIDFFSRVYPNNARPIQPTSDRTILETEF